MFHVPLFGRLRLISSATIAMFLAVLVLNWSALARAGELVVGADVDAKAVTLVIDFGGRRDERRFEVTWEPEMTALQTLVMAAADQDDFSFVHRGKGATAFVTSIDGLDNEGGKAGGRNWIFKVNGSKLTQSAGVTKLSAADVVLWKFSTSVE